MASSSSLLLVVNGTLHLPGDGNCTATPPWPMKPLDATWEFDVSLLPGSGCSASEVTLAYARARGYVYKYSIDEWRAGS